MSETEHPPKKLGIRVDTITVDFMNEIVKIYGDTVGKTSRLQTFSQNLGPVEIDDIKEDLVEKGYCERRLGSSLDTESKLVFKSTYRDDLYLIQFSPNLNSGLASKLEKAKANETVRQFALNINEFLTNSGLGIETKAL